MLFSSGRYKCKSKHQLFLQSPATQYMKTMIRIWLFLAIFGSFTFSALSTNGGTNNDVLLQFRVNETTTVFCPNQSVCSNPSSIAWNISLGGVPVENCNERCHLLFFVNFGTHTPGVTPGAIFSAASYTSTRDLYRFIDMLNNYYPYILGYEFGWAYGGFSVAGGSIPTVDLTNATIHDIKLTINSFTATAGNVSGSYALNLTYDLTFTVYGNWHPNLTTISALPTGDSFVRNGTYSTENYGSLDYLLVSENYSDPSATRYSYFKFDLFYWNAINKATLKLWGGALDNASIAALAYSVNGTFNESTITWANAPTINLTASLFPTYINASIKWYEFDITPLVRELYPYGNGTIYFALVAYYGGALRFSSREGSFPPFLEIYAVVPQSEQETLPPIFSIVEPPAEPTAAPYTAPTSTSPTASPTTAPYTAPTSTPTTTTTSSSTSEPVVSEASGKIASVVAALGLGSAWLLLF